MVSVLRRRCVAPPRNARDVGHFEPYLLAAGQALSISEIFLEKLSLSLQGESGRRTSILVIESSKALLRLLVLMERRDATMLLKWGTEQQEKIIKLSDYYLFYKKHYARLRTNSSAFPRSVPFTHSTYQSVYVDEEGNTTAAQSVDSEWSDGDELMDENGLPYTSFIGRRSGIVLKMPVLFN